MARDPLRQIQRNAHLISRAAGDLAAARRGTLVKRVVRRRLTRAFWQALRK